MYTHIVPSQFVAKQWPVIEPFLAKPFAKGVAEYSLDQLKASLVFGQQTMFVFYADAEVVGAMSVAIENYPNARVAFVTAMGGEGIVDPDVFEQVKEWCCLQGCTHIRGNVQDSVARLMSRKLGMTKRYTVMESVL